MANINFKDILDFNGITTREDVLTVDYTTETGRGRFTVFLPDRFPTTAHNMKLFIDMFLKAGNPEETARGLYEYLKKCSDYLTDFRNRIEGINDTEKKDRAALAAAIKKYNANIEALCKVFAFDQVQDTDAIKMQKTDVVTVIYDRAKNTPVAVNKTGYRFTKAGRVFHVYKENKTVYIIIPEVGQAVATYTGDIKTAPEYITARLLDQLAKIDLIPLYNNFIEILKESDNIILNNDIKTPETAPATTEEKEPAPAAVPEADQTATAPTEANQTPETARPEPVKDPDNDTTRDNIQGIYNRHNTASALYAMQLYKVVLYYRFFTNQTRPEKAHNGILCNNGINDHRRQKAAFMKPYNAQKRHNITPGYTEVVQDPGPVRSLYETAPAYYNRIQAAPPGIWTAYRANIPPYYNTS